MQILIIMSLGCLIGAIFFPKQFKHKNEKLQVICTILLIFCMGIMLGKRENFMDDIVSLGFTSFLYFFVPTLFSTILVYFLTNSFMNKRNQTRKKDKKK